MGNGFDLAHGLKTSYNDFANYYLEEIIVDELLNLDSNSSKKHFLNNKFVQNKNIIKYKGTTVAFSYNELELDWLKNLLNHISNQNINEVLQCLNSNNDYIKLLISNKLLGKLYSNSFENWFDIEQAYYEELKGIYNSPKENHNEELDILNKNLQEIKEALKKYLNDKIKPTWSGSVNNSFENHFIDRENISFINFNYTNTINCYRDLANINSNIHIHNSLSEDIIFGYGDDTDEMYQQMKASKNNDFLKYFKTFDYLKSKNYRKVLNQLAAFKDGYDVLVIGHSLGGTDKTILKTILDNNSCQNIELLKRSDLDSEKEKEDNSFELHANLARIFDSEASLRKKVISLQQSVNFPLMTSIDYTTINEREKELFPRKSNHVTIKTTKTTYK
ncbi:AbiH family protein [Tenacibaculum pacificus]|nr:AbiH family protein [Tenacibaculum pacificus]WBX74798.1 AbiH family protein [Tenacibaculum pacificus]